MLFVGVPVRVWLFGCVLVCTRSFFQWFVKLVNVLCVLTCLVAHVFVCLYCPSDCLSVHI